MTTKLTVRHKTNNIKIKTYITLLSTDLKDIETILFTQVSPPQIPAPAFIHLAMSLLYCLELRSCFLSKTYWQLHHSFLTANVAKEKLEVPIFEDTLFSSNV
jgi:hypothetical protein